MDWSRFDWPNGAPHYCGGVGCDECESTGLCPGCGKPWEGRASSMPAEMCAEIGVLPWACRSCGKHWRRPEWLN